MSKLQPVKEFIIEQYSKIQYLPLKTEALEHTLACMSAAGLLARARSIDPNLACTAALLHDYGKFALNSPLDHAKTGSFFAMKYLSGQQGFTAEEIKEIALAIAVHSDKKRVDSPLAELLKDADVYSRILAGDQIADLSQEKKQRARRAASDIAALLSVSHDF